MENRNMDGFQNSFLHIIKYIINVNDFQLFELKFCHYMLQIEIFIRFTVCYQINHPSF